MEMHCDNTKCILIMKYYSTIIDDGIGAVLYLLQKSTQKEHKHKKAKSDFLHFRCFYGHKKHKKHKKHKNRLSSY